MEDFISQEMVSVERRDKYVLFSLPAGDKGDLFCGLLIRCQASSLSKLIDMGEFFLKLLF